MGYNEYTSNRNEHISRCGWEPTYYEYYRRDNNKRYGKWSVQSEMKEKTSNEVSV